MEAYARKKWLDIGLWSGISGCSQGNRTLMRRVAGGKLRLDLDKKGELFFLYSETRGQTGMEMEALTSVQVVLLTIYDMCKAVDKGMVMDNIRFIEKKGGKSGHWKRDET